MITTKHLTSLILAGMSFILAPLLMAETPEQTRIKELEAKLKALETAQPANNQPAPPAAAAQPPAPEYKKGLWLTIWTAKGTPLEKDIPDWGDVGSIALAKQPFSLDAVKNDPDCKNYFGQPLFFMLDGYIKITKAGEHTLTVDLEYTNTNFQLKLAKYSIYLQGNALSRSESKNLHSNQQTVSISADADLAPGMYRVQIPVDVLSREGIYQYFPGENYNKGIQITLKLKEPGARRARVLAEDDLFHKE